MFVQLGTDLASGALEVGLRRIHGRLHVLRCGLVTTARIRRGAAP